MPCRYLACPYPVRHDDGLCDIHHLTPTAKLPSVATCIEPNCPMPAAVKMRCRRHYARARYAEEKARLAQYRSAEEELRECPYCLTFNSGHGASCPFHQTPARADER